MKRLVTTTTLLGLLVPSIASADNPARPEMNLALDEYSIQLRDFNFPSGLRIIFQEDHSQPIVSITSVIDRGASHDPIGKEGIAHLVEHMWFQSKHGDLPKVWDVLEELGANLNASTASDWTNYMTVASADSTVPLLRLEALRMENPIAEVTESDLAEEREVVRNELRMRYENTSSTFLYYLRSKLYPVGHPYHRLGIGTHDSLNNITLEDVQLFVDENYTPENTTIVVVGDFDIVGTDPETGETYNNAWRMIQQAFPMELLVDPNDPEADLELGDPPVRVSPTADEPPEVADREISYHKGGTEKPTLFAGWTLPGGYRASDMTAQMAVSAMNSAIQTYLNEDFDITTDDISDISNAGCFYWAEEVTSTAICYTEMSDAADAPDKLEDMLDGLYKMWEISDSETIRTWQKILFDNSRMAQMAYTFRTVEIVSSIGNGRAAETANFTHFTGDPLYYSRSFENLNNVDMKEVREFAQKYLNRDRAAAVVVEPYGEDDVVLDSSDAIYKGAVRRETTYSMVDLSEVNAEMLTGIMSPPNLTEMREFELDNGLNVVLVPYGEAPVLQVAAFFQSSPWDEPIEGLDQFTHSNLDYDYYSALPLAGSYFAGVNADGFRWQGVNGSSANFDGLVWLLRKRVESLRPYVNDRGTFLTASKKSIRYSRSFPEYWGGIVSDDALYPDHYLSSVTDEVDVESWRSIGMGDMQGWVNRIYRPENGTLYVVGRMEDPDAVEASIRKSWEGWTVKGEHTPFTDMPAAPEPQPRSITVINKERVTQSNVRLTCQTGPATLENKEAIDMFAGLMDRSAWVALREQAGVTYGAGSYAWSYRGGAAAIMFNSLVQNDAVGLAVDVFLDMSKRASEGDLDEDRLTVNKLGAARKYVLGHQTSGQMLNRIASAQTSGYGWDFINKKAERLADVTTDDITALAERCYEKEAIVITGPAAVITPQLDELGVEYTVFDWKAEKERLFMENDPKAYKKAKKKEARDAKKKARKEAKEAKKSGE